MYAAAGRQWSRCARLLCDCTAWALQAGGVRSAGQQIKKQRCTSQMLASFPSDPMSETCDAHSRGSGPSRAGLLAAAAEAWAALMALQPSVAGTASGLETQLLLRLAEQLSHLGLLPGSSIFGREEPVVAARTNEYIGAALPVNLCGSEQVRQQVQAVAVLASWCMARAGCLLQLAYGETHALCEATMFAPCFSDLDWPLASAISAAAQALDIPSLNNRP